MFQGTSLLAAVLSGGELRARPSDYLRVALLVCLLPIFSSFSWTQALVPTSRVDNTRSNADTQETILTPGNVNSATFGHLFSDAVDYVVMAQPLYVPNVNTGHGIHNVVYVVTQADSVYAFDADNGTQLWYASMLNNVGAGATTASGANLPCGTAAGFNQEGIIGTPAIDSATNTMYLVAKTALAGVVRHHLHALDITTGNEQPGSPVLIQATSTSNKGKKTVFNSLHQKNRPGLLLLNGVVYMGFGSNYCNDSDSGWVLGYDASSLAQLAVFNTSPDTGLTSIWQSGSGLTADESGYIFVETAEAGNNSYDIQNGGQTYCNSVLKLTPDLTVADFFTPALVPFLNSNDFDLSSTGAIVLPDQRGPYPHELVAGGKYGVVYVLNRDNLGMYSPSTDQIVQEITLVQQNPNALKDVLFGSPAYWNNTVYFAPDAAPVMAFPVSGGLLGNPPGTPIETTARYTGSHSPSISANGNTNGILWVISGGLNAFDAVSLKLLYNSKQAPGGRDALGTVGHFVTQTVANGKVYVTDESQTTPIPIYALEAYGLLSTVTFTSGGGQSAVGGSPLANPILVRVADPASGQAKPGATVNFSDGCAKAGSATCGSFDPASATTDFTGSTSTTYTVPRQAGTYTLTATAVVNGTGAGSATTTATATAGSGLQIVAISGAGQTDSAGFPLPKPIVAKVLLGSGKAASGVTVNFSANQKGSTFNPAIAVTGANGQASTVLTLPLTPVPITVTVTATCSGCTNSVNFAEYSVAPILRISIAGGNQQAAPAGTRLSQALAVLVSDQFGNPIVGDSVTFSDNGAGGTFSNGKTVSTGSNGTATEFYTLPAYGASITVTATASGVSGPAVFTEISESASAAKIAVSSGNNQSAPSGTQLPHALVVLVTNKSGNPAAGVPVVFSDDSSGGVFSNPNAVTGSDGTANSFYTLPPFSGADIYITATAAGVSTPAAFNEYSQ